MTAGWRGSAVTSSVAGWPSASPAAPVQLAAPFSATCAPPLGCSSRSGGHGNGGVSVGKYINI